MKHLSWILTVPLMIVAVVFAVANRAGATLNLWPLGITVEAPLFILVLGSVFVGLLVGGAIAWLSAGAARRRAREARHRAEAAEREVARLRNALESNRPSLPGQSRIPAAGA